MLKLGFRPRDVGRVLWAAWPAWLCIVAIGVALVVGIAVAPSDADGFRLAGTVLELCGLVTVATGIHQLRNLFGRPSTLDSTRNWLRQLAKAWQPPESVVLATSTANVNVSTPIATALRSANPNATLEERVSVLEADVTALRNDLTQQRDWHETDARETRKAIKREEGARQAADQRAAKQLEEVSVGGLHLEKLGLCWLVFGILFANLSEEMADLLYFCLGLGFW